MVGNFIKIHNDFVRNRELRPTEKIVYMCIKAYAFTGECFPSVKRLAHDAGVCARTVQRCVKTLCEKGVISVERRKNESGGFTTNLYRVNEEREQKTQTENFAETAETPETAETCDTNEVFCPAFEYRGSDETLREIGVADTEKYRRIFRRIARLGLLNREECLAYDGV